MGKVSNVDEHLCSLFWSKWNKNVQFFNLCNSLDWCMSMFLLGMNLNLAVANLTDTNGIPIDLILNPT